MVSCFCYATGLLMLSSILLFIDECLDHNTVHSWSCNLKSFVPLKVAIRVRYTFVSGPSEPYWKVSRTFATDEAKKGPIALLQYSGVLPLKENKTRILHQVSLYCLLHQYILVIFIGSMPGRMYWDDFKRQSGTCICHVMHT